MAKHKPEDLARMRALAGVLLLARNQPQARWYPSWNSTASRAIRMGRDIIPPPTRAELDALRSITIGEIITGEMPVPPEEG